ncbi:MAG: hypothetical protein ACUVSS_16680, partial [Anaerolineae bacterium]
TSTIPMMTSSVPSHWPDEMASPNSQRAATTWTPITASPAVIGVGEGGILYTHCLDATHSAEYAAEAQALRRKLLSKIFV